MKTFILFTFSVLLIFGCCQDDAFPRLDVPDYELENIAQNAIDQNRICLAETLSKALAQENFRVFLREQSINQNEPWNNEFLLVTHLQDVVYDNLTFIDVIEQVILSNEDLCIASREEFEQKLLDDPLLVLKLPDVFTAEEWDPIRTVPYLYTQTTDLINSTALSEYQGILGLHPSGAVDVYLSGNPKYFPLVLKYSEDYIALDQSLRMLSGVSLSSYHYSIPNEAYGSSFFNSLTEVPGTVYRLAKVNDLLTAFVELREENYTPYPWEDCGEQCVYACIPEEERKLTAVALSVSSQNENALEYEYSTVYRPNDHFILHDNITPLSLTRKQTVMETYPWQRLLYGSFHISSIFEVDATIAVAYESFEVFGEVHELPLLDLTYEVMGKNNIPINTQLLADHIDTEDQLRYSIYRVVFDLVEFTQVAYDNEIISTYDVNVDGIQNYSLYCISQDMELGFNSIKLICDF